VKKIMKLVASTSYSGRQKNLNCYTLFDDRFFWNICVLIIYNDRQTVNTLDKMLH